MVQFDAVFFPPFGAAFFFKQVLNRVQVVPELIADRGCYLGEDCRRALAYVIGICSAVFQLVESLIETTLWPNDVASESSLGALRIHSCSMACKIGNAP